MSITASQSPELFWLTAATVLTAILWVPYVLNRIFEAGLCGALSKPPAGPGAAWAVRTVAAHRNAAENLVIFAPLVLVAVFAHRTGPGTAQAAATYFFARLVHAIVYPLGIPVVRTLAFAVGWVACLRIALVIFGF